MAKRDPLRHSGILVLIALTACSLLMISTSASHGQGAQAGDFKPTTDEISALQRKADAGDKEAALELGLAYLTSEELDPGQKKALTIFRALAETGYGPAQNMMGALYRTGTASLPADAEQAVAWFEKAYAQGDKGAAANLASYYHYGIPPKSRDHTKASALYKACAEELPHCNFQLGKMAWLGQGQAADAKAGFNLIKIAAERNHAEAMTYLGKIYNWSDFSGHDPAKAMSWFRKAAELGDGEAAWNVGMAFVSGQGVAKDSREAVRWFERAVAAEYPAGMVSLATMFATGDGVAVDYGRARALYEKAAQAGVIEAYQNLAVMYRNGEGVAVNLEEALYFALVGRNLGDDNAANLVSVITSEATPGVRAAAEKRFEAWRQARQSAEAR